MTPSAEHHDTYLEWLYLEADGELGANERRRLAAHLDGCEACRSERASLEGLAGLLAASRVPVRRGFRGEVLAALPDAGWEARAPRGWAAAVVALVALFAAAVAVTVEAPASVDPGVWGAVGAVADLLRTTLLAGAGLLTASWHGMGAALERALGGSLWNVAAFGVLVLGLDILFLRLLLSAARARRPELETTSGRGRGRPAR